MQFDVCAEYVVYRQTSLTGLAGLSDLRNMLSKLAGRISLLRFTSFHHRCALITCNRHATSQPTTVRGLTISTLH